MLKSKQLEVRRLGLLPVSGMEIKDPDPVFDGRKWHVFWN